MPEVHHPPSGGKGGDPPAARPIDWSNRDEVRAWLADLRAQVDDAVAAGEDATRPPGRRELGRRAARRAILQAGRALEQILTVAERGVDAPA
jgi:hypothetical protein